MIKVDGYKSLIFHSDQEVSYTFNEYRNLLHTAKVKPSFPKKDNAF